MSVGPSFEVVPIADVPSDARALFPEPLRPVILVVDDERLIADTLTAVLRQSGFAAMAAYGGYSALELTAVIPPQLLITDIAMPGMSGIELALAMVDTIPECKILLFSGHADHIDLLEARNAGYHFPLLTKPLHPSRMLQHVRESLTLPPWPSPPLRG